MLFRSFPTDITIHQRGFDIMESENGCDGSKWFQPESRADLKFRTTSDEEPDLWDLIHKAGEYRKNCRCRLFIFALIKSINDDQGLDFCPSEWTNNDFLHLGTKGFLLDTRVGPQDLEQSLLELGISVCKLECKCGEDGFKVTPGLRIS